MKKTMFAILAVVIVAACLLAGCKGADGGKITDAQQDISEAMTGVQDMLTDISEAFTTVPESVVATVENITD